MLSKTLRERICGYDTLRSKPQDPGVTKVSVFSWPYARASGESLALQEHPDSSCQFDFGLPLLKLNSSDQLIALPCDELQIVIGKLAPSFFDGPFHLFPFTSCLFPVHASSNL
jgi:hypothetical protein